MNPGNSSPDTTATRDEMELPFVGLSVISDRQLRAKGVSVDDRHNLLAHGQLFAEFQFKDPASLPLIRDMNERLLRFYAMDLSLTPYQVMQRAARWWSAQIELDGVMVTPAGLVGSFNPRQLARALLSFMDILMTDLSTQRALASLPSYEQPTAAYRVIGDDV